MQNQLAALFNVSVSWVPRLANMAAHSIPKWFLSCKFFGSFDLGCCPPCRVKVVWIFCTKLSLPRLSLLIFLWSRKSLESWGYIANSTLQMQQQTLLACVCCYFVCISPFWSSRTLQTLTMPRLFFAWFVSVNCTVRLSLFFYFFFFLFFNYGKPKLDKRIKKFTKSGLQ